MGNTYNVANENAVAIDTSEKISRNIFDSNSISEALSSLLLLERKVPPQYNVDNLVSQPKK